MGEDTREKETQQYVINHGITSPTRISWTAAGIQISGAEGAPAVTEREIKMWNEMQERYDVRQQSPIPSYNCAEAHMWLHIVLHRMNPKKYKIWTYKLDGRNRIKEDSRCLNCQQWVQGEFLAVNPQ